MRSFRTFSKNGYAFKRANRSLICRMTILLLITSIFHISSCKGTGDVASTTALIIITPSSLTLTSGNTFQLTAVLRDQWNDIDTGANITWTSSDQSKVTVSTTGLLKAIAAGTVTITAKSPDYPDATSGTALVTVEESTGIITMTKFELWNSGVELRGVNIWIGKADDPIYEGALGTGRYGPVFNQADFEALAAAGCNYVNISHPGLYSVSAPYSLDMDAQTFLDGLLEMIQQADMFAVITIRTGPGRSEWTFHWGNDTTTDPKNGWFPASYYNEDVWKKQTAQDAWVTMWGDIAARYKDNKTVVAFDLMCEPNSELTQYGLGDPEEFYPLHEGKLADWNHFFPDIIAAIRAVDTKTPIIVGGMGWSGVEWLSYIEPSTDTKVIYAIHQYEPGEYTHQETGDNISYPGTIDGEQINADWLAAYLQPISIFTSGPVVCNELGLVRWSPNADKFMDDEIRILEQMGVAHAVWAWEVAGGIDDGEQDAFNFRLGPDPANTTDIPSNALYVVYKTYWAKNRYRPSNVIFQ